MVNAVSNSVVPKFTVITGNSYGAGNYAMCGKAYDPRLIVAWPWSELAVMGGSQAAKVLAQIQESTLKKQGKEISEEEHQEILDTISKRYQKQTEPVYAAARLWTCLLYTSGSFAFCGLRKVLVGFFFLSARKRKLSAVSVVFVGTSHNQRKPPLIFL